MTIGYIEITTHYLGDWSPRGSHKLNNHLRGHQIFAFGGPVPFELETLRSGANNGSVLGYLLIII